jgi:hypothetical protein
MTPPYKALRDFPLHAPIRVGKPDPITIDEAVEAIDSMLNEETRLFLSVANERTAVNELHHTLGRYLSSKWGLSRGSPLARHLEQVHGASQADEMSNMIISAYCQRGTKLRFQLPEDPVVECNLEEVPSSPG